MQSEKKLSEEVSPDMICVFFHFQDVELKVASNR